MVNLGDALWEINNEYRKQLSLLMGHLKLLEELLRLQGQAEPAVRAAIRRFRAILEDIDADHHDWRHTYFYTRPDGSDKRRMVGEPAAIDQALRTFTQMYRDHALQFKTMQRAFGDLPRPDPALTRVLKGSDLWEMCLTETAALAGYRAFLAQRLTGQPYFF